MTSKLFTGTGVALITPFDENLNVREGFLELAKIHKNSCLIIDADKSREEIAKEAWEYIKTNISH